MSENSTSLLLFSEGKPFKYRNKSKIADSTGYYYARICKIYIDLHTRYVFMLHIWQESQYYLDTDPDTAVEEVWQMSNNSEAIRQTIKRIDEVVNNYTVFS